MIQAAKQWAISLPSHLCWELHMPSTEPNGYWLIRAGADKYPCLQSHSNQQRIPIAPFPTDDKSQMLVEFMGFMSSECLDIKCCKAWRVEDLKGRTLYVLYVSTSTILNPFRINNIGTICLIPVMILNISPSTDRTGMQWDRVFCFHRVFHVNNVSHHAVELLS